MKKYNDIEQSKKIAEHLASVMQKRESNGAEEFDQWVKENPSASDILAELSDQEKLTSKYEHFSAKNKKIGAEKMLHKISTRQRKRIFVKFSSAAAVLIALSFVVLYWVDLPNQTIIKEEIAMTKIEEKVKFILENGDVVELNSDVDSIQTSDILLHNSQDKNTTFVDKQLNINSKILITRLVVPKEKSYAIVLSDGTKVTLNANSELSFPNRFEGDTREVTIKGEGYFEVAKNREIPFIVHSAGSLIKVYGTKFNVNNYDLQQIETILIEGSIGITTNNKEQILKPNQLVTINNSNGQSKVDDVRDISKYVAWTNGYFIFQSDNLPKAINELSRWYNVEFETDNLDVNIPISGSFSRDTELDEIIKSLEMISGVKLIKKRMPMTK